MNVEIYPQLIAGLIVAAFVTGWAWSLVWTDLRDRNKKKHAQRLIEDTFRV